MAKKLKLVEMKPWREIAKQFSTSEDMQFMEDVIKECPQAETFVRSSWEAAWQLDYVMPCLEIVATGIKRDRKKNSCWLTGTAMAVHAVENLLHDLKILANRK